MNAIQTLFDFIAAAERSRKYPSSTATNYRTPLRLIEPELNEEEETSMETLKSHLEQIFSTVYNKNKSKMAASSFEVYKRRIKALVSDYEKYGIDPSKMAAWNREIVTRKKVKKETEISKRELSSDQFLEEEIIKAGEGSSKLEMPLSTGKAIIIIPVDSNLTDIEMIEDYINFLKKTKPGYKENNQSQQEQSQNNSEAKN